MSPRIPITDPKREYSSFKAAIDEALQSVLDSGRYILGRNVIAFEREVADYLGVGHAVAVASGTDALHLALRACGIGEGDEVITTPFTFIGTAEAISYTGATPVFVDIDPVTYTLDPARVGAAVTPRTRAVIAVHLYGQAADLDPVIHLCRRHRLHLIEDCAQAFGAEYRGRKTGALGDLGCFSFYPSKNLGAFGDGGLVSTDDPALAEALRMLRNHGSDAAAPHRHGRIGYNSRLDELQAAVLRVKLRHIDELNRRRQEWAKAYRSRLQGIVTPPAERAPGEHVYNLYTIRHPRREVLARRLEEDGIASAVHYRSPLHRQPVYRDLHAARSLPAAERAAAEVLSLPMFPGLTREEFARICRSIETFAEQGGGVTAIPAL